MRRALIALCAFTLVSTTSFAQEKPAPVDQYGDALPAGAIARLGTVRLRHPDWVRSFAISADGKTLASAGDESIRLWELPSGRPLKKYPIFREKDEELSGIGRAPAVAFTEKGGLIALGNYMGSILYDPTTGKELKRFKEYSTDLLSADGRFAVLAGEKHSALWDVTTGKEVQRVPDLRGAAGPLPTTLSLDGKMLAICSPGRIRRIDISTGKELAPIRNDHGPLLSSAFAPALSRDGKLLAAAIGYPPSLPRVFSHPQDIDSDIVLWDTESGKKLRLLKTYGRFLAPLAFSPDSKLLAAGIGDMTYVGGKTIVLLDTATGKEVDRPVGHEAAVYSVAFVAGTNTVVSGCEHSTLRTWDATNGNQLRESRLPPRMIRPLLSPDGKWAAWSNRDRIHLHGIAANKESRKLELPQSTLLCFSVDGRCLAAWSDVNEGELRLWETDTGKELGRFRAKEVLAIAISTDCKFIVRCVSSNLTDAHVELVDLNTGKNLRQFNVNYDLDRLAVSPDGKFLACSHGDQAIVLWDLAKGEQVWRSKHPARDRGPRTSLSFACPVAFSPDGRRLATGGDDQSVRLWDVATGKETLKFAGHEDTIQALAFSADGKRLASASSDTSVLIWKVDEK
jgi:WD40 repeat protein